ncbi:MAG: helix-turn-helix transcriptional regulator, partial [Proteobacteria bacterium]|nr:helix-turn-helix transcriptional regulator [Pseudomonadota bacterium]
MSEMDNVGLHLKQLRTRQRLSQRQLARNSGVSNATISLIEHGRTDPSMGLLKRILDSMGVSFADFFASDARQPEKYFFTPSELNEIGSGPISYLQ